MKSRQEGVELQVIPVDQLEIDNDVQLEFTFNDRRARAIGANFDFDAVGVPRACKGTDGKYYVWDGRHRVRGAKYAGVKTLRVDVYKPMSVKRRCELKLAFDKDRRSVKPLENFLIRERELDPVVLDIVKLAKGAGYKIGPTKNPTTFQCAVVLEYLYEQLGPDGLRTVFNLNTTWKGDPGTTLQAWILALGLLVRDGHNDAIVKKISNLKSVVPLEIIRKAEGDVLLKGGAIQRGAVSWRPMHAFMADRICKAARVRLVQSAAA